MIFTPDQIEELVNIIKFQHVLFGVNISGKDVISSEDLKLLRSFGVHPDTLDIKGLTPIDYAFQFGRLAAALGNYQAKDIKFNDFKRFVQGGGHRALNDHEKQMVKSIREQSFQAVKGLGQRVAGNFTNIISAEDIKNRANYETILRNELTEGVLNRKSVAEIIRELGLKTGDWERDLGRLVETESHNAYETGRASEYFEKYGQDVEVYKDVYAGACKYCIEAYLTGGIGSEPKIFKLSSLQLNGTNIGRTPKDYLATLTSLHPHCRCTMNIFQKGFVWNSVMRIFSAPKGYKQRYSYNITVTIGSNNYNI